MIRAGFTDEELRVAARNLLQAYVIRDATPEYSQSRLLAAAAFEVLCDVGARMGLAESAEQLEVIVADALDQVRPTAAPVDGGPDWAWLMQARFLLARRLCGGRGGVEAA